jgi:hypothetical protein
MSADRPVMNNGPVGYIIRGVITIAVIAVYGWINFLLNPVGTLGTAKMASKQFENTDTGYVVSLFGMNFFKNVGIPALVLVLVLIWIWWKPIKSLFKANGAPFAGLILALLASTQLFAYYDKADYTEAYFILPNESAFFIPDAGANKEGQSQFGSEQYLRENKIAAKRFIIPHAKLSGSGAWSDFYVPTGRLIIVDRTPYNREWVKSVARGTAAKNQGFPVQSKEGLNITLGIAIATSVTEDDSPRFLFRFGVKPPTGDRHRPEVIFTSVYYGRGLTEVMDGVVRDKVQALLGNEFTKRTFDEANAQAEQIMASVQANLEKYLKSVGITLDYIGWADTFEFDPSVQDAINRRYIATQDEAIAQKLEPHTLTIQRLATAEALRSFGNKTDGKLPTNVSLWWLPSSFSDFFERMFKPSSETAAPAGNVQKK